MAYMFYGAISFNQLLKFNRDNVATMYCMFNNSGMEKMAS